MFHHHPGNIGVNGTDGHGNECKTDTYCCFCADRSSYKPVPCNMTLGRENVRDYFGGQTITGGIAPWGCRDESSPPWECFKSHLPEKFTDAVPGYWYSSLKEGYCGDDADGRRRRSSSSSDCTWRVVRVEKIVSKKCHNKVFYGAVEKAGADCLNTKCSASDRTNSSTACWTTCFYETVLGPGGAKAGGKVAGMPLSDLVAAWTAPFESEDPAEGGCPALPQ